MLYVIAVLGDLASFWPGVNIVSGAITTMLLGIVGSATGVSLFSSSRIGGTLGMILAEEMPVIASFPTFTLRVYLANNDGK